jgi:hypothetical protein
MSDVFISYKREDRAIAARLAKVFADAGLSVFFDASIPVGDMWDETIEAELNAARAVVVLWSAYSVESRWVRLEARRALERRTLLPALVQDCAIPLEFSDIQSADIRTLAIEELSRLLIRAKALCEDSENFSPVGALNFPTATVAIVFENRLYELLRTLTHLCNEFLGGGEEDLPFLLSKISDKASAVSDLYEAAYDDGVVATEFGAVVTDVECACDAFDSHNRAGAKDAVEQAAHKLAVLTNSLHGTTAVQAA